MIWAQRGDGMFPLFLDFLSQRIWGERREIAGDTLLGVPIGGSIRAVVAFHNYDQDAGVMEISAASDSVSWMRRSVMREVFGYIFDQCGCQAAVMRCDPDDDRMSHIAQGLGFERFDLPRLRGRDKSEAIYILADDVWRKGKFHGKISA